VVHRGRLEGTLGVDGKNGPVALSSEQLVQWGRCCERPAVRGLDEDEVVDAPAVTVLQGGPLGFGCTWRGDGGEIEREH
jgi:hypothetical protein